MKLIINTVIENHFCCLFDEDNTLVTSHEWEDKKTDGSEIFNFCKKHINSQEKISFIGGVSGPGGFSSLRVASCIINTFGFKYDIPVHQVRADIWAKELLGHSNFFLNTFGKAVWEIKDKKLSRIDLEEANTSYAAKEKFLGFLPPEKQELLSDIIPMKDSLKNKEEILLTCLLKQSSKESFLPDYEFPAVQS